MMNKMNLQFDWKVMGANAYIPLIVLLVSFLYSMILQDELRLILSVYEFVIPAFSAWWTIFIFQDVIEEPGSESIFSYPVSRWTLGLMRVIAFYFLYIVLLLILLMIVSYSIDIGLYPVYLQLCIQSLFFTGFGYLSMMILRNSGWAMFIVASYSSFQILTKGSAIPLINIYFFNTKVASLSQIFDSLILIFIIGIIFLLLGQVMFIKPEKFNE